MNGGAGVATSCRHDAGGRFPKRLCKAGTFLRKVRRGAIGIFRWQRERTAIYRPLGDGPSLRTAWMPSARMMALGKRHSPLLHEPFHP